MKLFESNRLFFRKITKADFSELSLILQNERVMVAWEYSFTDEQVEEWIEKTLTRYDNDGLSYFAVIRKDGGELIGVAGTMTEEFNEETLIEVAYLFNESFWGKGYAVESANACIKYTFNSINTDRIVAQIRPTNLSSCKVATRCGMTLTGDFIKCYNGNHILHHIYTITREEYETKIAKQ